MAKKPYDWLGGAELNEHSKRKHKILREYVSDYVRVRCTLPQQERFRLAVVDGFAGGGRYQCGTAGSPLIFIEELRRASDALNLQRAGQGLSPIEIECLLVFNDYSRDIINLLKKNCAPLLATINEDCPRLHLRVEYMHDPFEVAYPKIKGLLAQGGYRSVLFNLDQCGDRHVENNTIQDIMRTFPAAEIFYTIMIESLLAFLKKNDPEQLRKRLAPLGVTEAKLQTLSGMMGRNEWLGTAESIVFDAFRLCAPYVSPFSINNPDGWRYWLVHFANNYRARQVYNNILHNNASLQAHFGRSGLNMLHYDPRNDERILYLFDDEARSSAKDQLSGDIPRLVTDSGDAMGVMEFYGSIYNMTPAHSDDVHHSIIENPDLEVITPSGGKRRKSNTIKIDDVIRFKAQRSFFPLFLEDRRDPRPILLDHLEKSMAENEELGHRLAD